MFGFNASFEMEHGPGRKVCKIYRHVNKEKKKEAKKERKGERKRASTKENKTRLDHELASKKNQTYDTTDGGAEKIDCKNSFR
jgi:hypothetical protein